MHYFAGLRQLLGSDNPIVSISAFSQQIQEHLPPVDTVDATAKCKNGATGTITISFGTTYKGSELVVACEKGFVKVERENVTVGDETRQVKDEGSGVKPELRAWGEALAAGRINEKQSPEEALADLELVEAMLRSGEQDGKPITLQCQTW